MDYKLSRMTIRYDSTTIHNRVTYIERTSFQNLIKQLMINRISMILEKCHARFTMIIRR